jgi:hypothetical protein
MIADWTLDATWWMTVVEVPALAGLLLLIWRVRSDLNALLETRCARVDGKVSDLRESLSAHQLDVARGYVPVETLRDTEGRITAHLVRIERKLDAVGFTHGGEL